MIGQIFENRGPLADFHSKILIAVGFGIIPPNLGDDMHRVKRIRNVFAHAKLDVTFNTVQISSEIQEFRMLKAMKRAEKEGENNKLDFSNKQAYLLMVRIICIIIDHEHRKLGGVPLLER
jgi:DNA-binding MltR family transcriptional regulator